MSSVVVECPSSISFISSALSSISIISWIFAQLPQIIKNYTTKSCDGISPLFLMLWFMGDFLSFTSCIINIETVLKFQLYISVFFLCNDITLCFQYYHYNYNYNYPQRSYIELHNNDDDDGGDDGNVLRERTGEEGVGNDDDGDYELPKTPVGDGDGDDDISIHQAQAIHRVSHHATNMTQRLSEEGYITSTPSSYDSTNEEGGRRNNLDNNTNGGIIKKSIIGTILQTGKTMALPISSSTTTTTSSTTSTFMTILSSDDSLGLVLAWGGTIVYCLSRCPQLYKNYKRKSVDGISPLLFGAALLGNLTYTLSILLSCEFYVGGEIQKKFIIKELPYIIGSSGTILFDIIYFIQKYLYRNNTNKNKNNINGGGGRPRPVVNANTMVLESWDDIESRHSNR